MVDGQDVVHERERSEDVWVVGVALRPVEEHPELVDLDQTEAPQHRVEAYAEVEEVQREEAEAVDVESRRVHVVLSKLDGVRLEDAVLEVARSEVEQDV